MKVSIVVPVYNIENYIEKCLESVLNQSFEDYECIMVNDGSKDNSYKVLEKYEALDKRFKILNKVNGGLSDARNAGLKLAKGDYIYFLDGDDYLEKNAIEECVNKFDITKADLVIFDVYQHNLVKNTVEILKNPFDETKVYNLENERSLLVNILNAVWNKMYKKSLFIENNIEYPFGYYYEDLGTTYRLLVNAKKIVFINKPLYNYLSDRPGNISQKFNMNIYHVLDMVKINIDYFKEKNIYDKYYEELKFLGCVNILECLKKTKNSNEVKIVNKFIDVCFYVMYREWPEFSKCKYKILREKNDWVYANKLILKSYLRLRRLLRK